MSLIAKWKKSWRELKAGTPGKRFQERYEKRHSDGGHKGRRVVTLVLGAVVFLAGLFFLPAPGPGMIIVALGAGMLAQESKWMAKALDWAELKIRKVVGWAMGIWRRASPAQKVGIVAVKLVAGAGVVWLTWRTFFA